ncbi:energy transducer TonB [Acinetobacter pittii]|jgi:TonB family protein|uniref:energy transducer TonB n=1 Tax=Acinetobacter TaxID=469 RepID=UPI0001CF7824|nr:MULTISPECIES: energy transducer TonB [Acinetobacter]KCY61107.1 tonB family C-terminal domain protein [Acinetobacter baumannii 1288284]QNB03065.1 TonB family protein [Acinetobacter baumannii]AVN22863.1 energy transducer TonB [Acinetobacter pittii]AVZ05778.1 energy transducer TonB [Acinetobacter pittii]EFF87903.1 TonB family domain protein [Acinetobacter sp. SH024]
MKSKSLFPTHKPMVMLPLPQGPKHFYKCLTVVVVIGLHVFAVWMLSHLIEPYTFKATPKVDALKVSFVSLAPAKKPSAEKIESQPKKSVTPQSTLNSSVSSVPEESKKSPTNVQTLVSKAAPKEVVQNNLNDKQQVQPKMTLNNLASSQAAQPTERRVAHNDKKLSSTDLEQTQTEHLLQNTNSETKSGGIKTPAMQQEYSKAPSTQVEHDDVVQVSSVDVLSFGGLDYDDRELKQQNRLVELRIRINEKGQSIDIQLRQSSGIQSLDERVMQATRKSRFKPHKINGRAVTIVVDFPVQLKLNRGR